MSRWDRFGFVVLNVLGISGAFIVAMASYVTKDWWLLINAGGLVVIVIAGWVGYLSDSRARRRVK